MTEGFMKELDKEQVSPSLYNDSHSIMILSIIQSIMTEPSTLMCGTTSFAYFRRMMCCHWKKYIQVSIMQIC